ncbi:TIGR03560 family F420-dependent LLM class oxidoreductase [Streptomyces sp. NPDC057654]|uniref:TIGR03560 family F420-dependent LLM class oxidoreductase n=1 Tax=Streptomyces sp. NPDC057654 TaxID=3346196 RepID=UPI00369294A8
MQLRIHTEPSERGASYATVLRVARAAEELGFDAFFRSDHYLQVGADAEEPGPSDAWLTLAALARDTRRVKLGTLVSPATFRSPGQLAIQVAQVDDMSGGRAELGLGAGWFEAEHEAYAIPYPGKRFARLEEQLRIVRGLWTTGRAERFDFEGEHFRLVGAQPTLPPVQRPHPPIIVGGTGAVRTPALAAAYADEYNAAFVSPEQAGIQYDRIRKALAENGRGQDSMRFSVIQTVCCGRTDAELRRRERALREPLPEYAFRGTPDRIADLIGQYERAGADRVYLRTLDLTDLDHLELVADRVLPQCAPA